MVEADGRGHWKESQDVDAEIACERLPVGVSLLQLVPSIIDVLVLLGGLPGDDCFAGVFASTERQTFDATGKAAGRAAAVHSLSHEGLTSRCRTELQDARLDRAVLPSEVTWEVHRGVPLPLGTRRCAWASTVVSEEASFLVTTSLDARPKLPDAPRVLVLKGERLPYSERGERVRISLRRVEKS
jgi:hypothetical protein